MGIFVYILCSIKSIMNFCKKCGNKLIEGSIFCNNCGNKIEYIYQDNQPMLKDYTNRENKRMFNIVQNTVQKPAKNNKKILVVAMILFLLTGVTAGIYLFLKDENHNSILSLLTGEGNNSVSKHYKKEDEQGKLNASNQKDSNNVIVNNSISDKNSIPQSNSVVEDNVVQDKQQDTNVIVVYEENKTHEENVDNTIINQQQNNITIDQQQNNTKINNTEIKEKSNTTVNNNEIKDKNIDPKNNTEKKKEEQKQDKTKIDPPKKEEQKQDKTKINPPKQEEQKQDKTKIEPPKKEEQNQDKTKINPPNDNNKQSPSKQDKTKIEPVSIKDNIIKKAAEKNISISFKSNTEEEICFIKDGGVEKGGIDIKLTTKKSNKNLETKHSELMEYYNKNIKNMQDSKIKDNSFIMSGIKNSNGNKRYDYATIINNNLCYVSLEYKNNKYTDDNIKNIAQTLANILFK